MVGNLERLTDAIEKNEEAKRELLRVLILENRKQISEALKARVVLRLPLPDGRILVIEPRQVESAT